MAGWSSFRGPFYCGNVPELDPLSGSLPTFTSQVVSSSLTFRHHPYTDGSFICVSNPYLPTDLQYRSTTNSKSPQGSQKHLRLAKSKTRLRNSPPMSAPPANLHLLKTSGVLNCSFSPHSVSNPSATPLSCTSKIIREYIFFSALLSVQAPGTHCLIYCLLTSPSPALLSPHRAASAL